MISQFDEVRLNPDRFESVPGRRVTFRDRDRDARAIEDVAHAYLDGISSFRRDRDLVVVSYDEEAIVVEPVCISGRNSLKYPTIRVVRRIWSAKHTR